MKKTIIYYDDDSVFITLGWRVDLAPSLGVVCIVDCNDIPHIHERSDYYVWRFREDGWTGVDIFGLWDYLQDKGMKKVLFGRTINNNDYERIRGIAYEELQRVRKEAVK